MASLGRITPPEGPTQARQEEHVESSACLVSAPVLMSLWKVSVFVFRTADGLLVVELGRIAFPGGPNEDVEDVEERGMNEASKDLYDSAESADELWSLYGNVAERHDESRIRTLKDDLDWIPVYVCTYFLM